MDWKYNINPDSKSINYCQKWFPFPRKDWQSWNDAGWSTYSWWWGEKKVDNDDMIRLWWRILLDLDVAQGSQFNGRLLINNWACTVTLFNPSQRMMMVTMMDNDNDMETLRWRGCCYNRLFFTWWQKGSHRQTHKYSWQFASLRTCVSTDTSRMARFDLLALKSWFLPAGKIHLHMAHCNENQRFFGLDFHHHFDSGINRKVFF